jgi:predicted ABC-type ATPase
MLEEIDRCGAAGMDFAFETTLAGKAYLQRIHQWQADGYRVKLIFLKLSHEEAAICRVAERVAQGGHSIPPEVIRRRFVSGLRNFTTLYQPIVDAWQLIDNGGATPHLIMQGGRS